MYVKGGTSDLLNIIGLWYSGSIMLGGFKNPKEALEYYKKRKKELEDKMEDLIARKEKGELSSEEFEQEKRKIEREFIEVMDRIAQLSYIAGGGP
ncbi:MAG: hypothetical protein DRJ47_02005 [Thermoprotei archaeon]|nr:MAG: hypothetical protein DRJ47_02005 [Thermoprotei archaeon]